ncbi:MAG: AAA family ATPase [Candidatus Nanoarchaeia archaeon]|nr:AAA family ATPase [Candidatus Nanoarchaeia archaeon]MDD5357665.1 AAA family ATPase [Candidatus Nanoarchaeia archaeon]MDD5588584.1 AAA family ATPase [Candidatus Nanoarchaeia archaeon]
MKIKQITLENIRSYESQEINFSDGSTLLSGDIGSGKTSVLLAIEFALFGLQPGQRGSALLRNGKKDGKVKITFEVDNDEITIERNLKKGKTISQESCFITINNEKKEFSVTELKSKILEILSYPSEFAKKQNILYKFTVYTPQEEMKQIILEDSETRINTLRHVFGIDKYKTILENVSILATKLREEKRMKEGMTANLEQNKSNLVTKQNELIIKQQNIFPLENELFGKKEARKRIQEEKEEVSKKIEEKNKLQSEIEKTKIMTINKRDSIMSNNKTIELLKKQIADLQELKFDESQISHLENSISWNKREKENLNMISIEISSKINSLNLKTDDNKKLEKKISSLEICPTCLQNVDSVYKANVLNKINADDVEISKQLQTLQLEKKEINEKIRNIDAEISLAEKQATDLKILKIKLQDVGEKQKQLEVIEKNNVSLEKDIELLKEHLDLLTNSALNLARFVNLLEVKQKELDSALREERLADIKVAELKKETEVFSTQIEELKREIERTEIVKLQLNYIAELENWLSKQFTSLISFIEKNVMLKLKVEFSKLFAEWFYILVSDNFNVRLSDDFTPIIEQSDYEIDYAHLSGGERTAIALAYRLALNQVINSLMSKIKTRDLVILDEPTDGFSEQQLDKMRDVLQQLNIKQLIIVSHEQKIEGFVSNVIKFRKENGITRVG